MSTVNNNKGQYCKVGPGVA